MRTFHIAIVLSVVTFVAVLGTVAFVARSSAETSAAEQQVAALEERVAELETVTEKTPVTSNFRVKFTTSWLFGDCLSLESFLDEDTSAYVNNGDGTSISTVRLGSPRIVTDDGFSGTCTFNFVFPDVPTNEAIYTINLGGNDIRSYSNREVEGRWLAIIDTTNLST